MGREVHLKKMDPYHVSLVIRYCHEGRFELKVLEEANDAVKKVAEELEVPGLIAICEAWENQK